MDGIPAACGSRDEDDFFDPQVWRAIGALLIVVGIVSVAAGFPIGVRLQKNAIKAVAADIHMGPATNGVHAAVTVSFERHRREIRLSREVFGLGVSGIFALGVGVVMLRRTRQFVVIPGDVRRSLDNVFADIRYNTFWPRFWAGFIDGLALAPFAALSGVVMNCPSRLIQMAWAPVHFLYYMAYSILMTGLYGQTIGKWLMKVRVLDLSEGPLTMRQAVMRDIVPLVLSVLTFLVFLGTGELEARKGSDPQILVGYLGLGWFLLEVVTMLINNKRRALHDFIARSVVVRVQV